MARVVSVGDGIARSSLYFYFRTFLLFNGNLVCINGFCVKIRTVLASYFKERIFAATKNLTELFNNYISFI